MLWRPCWCCVSDVGIPAIDIIVTIGCCYCCWCRCCHWHACWLWHPFCSCAGILEQSRGAGRNRIWIGLSYRPARLHRLAESIPWNWFLGPHKFKNTASGVAAAADGILLLLVILLFPVFLPLLVFYADGCSCLLFVSLRTWYSTIIDVRSDRAFFLGRWWSPTAWMNFL